MGERTANVTQEDLGEIIKELVDIIRDRQGADENKSYTARLLNSDENILYKKIIEEAFELVMASRDKDHDHIRYEAADLMYHFLVLLERMQVGIEELAGELKARMS